MGLRRRGQIRLVEVALASILAITLLILVSQLNIASFSLDSKPEYEDEASHILRKLSLDDTLCRSVYYIHGSPNGEVLREAIEGLLSPGIGYRILILRASDSAELYVYASMNFNPSRSSSSFIVLSGCNGFFEPRIVILTISGG